MRRTLRWMIGAGGLTFAACDGTTTEPPSRSPTLFIGHDTTLLVDEVHRVRATATDEHGRLIVNPSITWTSSAPTVASVDGSGHVTALAFGTALLTATMHEISAEITVTVAPQFKHIATGETHACGITGRDEIYCWGMSARGELGSASTLQDCSARFGPGIKCSPVPVRSASLRAATVVAGAMHTCALDADGTAYCWGANFYGQGGTGSQWDALSPARVVGGHRFTQLVAGRMHTCGITGSRDAYCWGWDWTGALGAGDVSAERCSFSGSDPCSRTPRLVVGGHEWAQLSATDRATCGVTTAGALYCWGLDVGGNDGMYCQIPDNLTGCTRTPMRIAPWKTYKATSIGNVHRCEQALDGTLECWGANYWGMFGNGTVNTYSATPVTAAGGAAYASFVASRTGTCGLRNDGRAQCWGRGAEGQVGNGSTQDAPAPANVSGGHRFVALVSSGSSDFVCGIADTGRAYCWGWGEFAQLGVGDFLSRSEPTLVDLIPASAPARTLATGGVR